MEQNSGLSPWPAVKISPPAARNGITTRALVSRPRLLHPLNAAATAGSVALVVAPGGSGKTSLLADWARQAPVPVAWYALDAADRDPRRLTSGLCTAVDRAMPGAARRAHAAIESGAPEPAAIGLLLGALEGQRLALVLDDFQHLDDRPDAMALWDHLLRFRPPTLALIILSRSVPLLGFAALAAMDDLSGLGRSDLAFDPAEAEELLVAHGLDPQPAAQLAARSGGWATGVLLLGRAGPDGMRFLRARVDALMEYLGAEILASLSPTLRRFLLETAAIGSASPAQADAILNRRDSAELYAEAAACDLFLEHEGEQYRYHDLFAEYLVGVLKAENPRRLRAIRRAAANWWCPHGDLPRALDLLAADEDWESLAAMLDRERAALWARGLWGTALTHVEHLPAEYRTPRLLALCGHARAQQGEHSEALAFADAGMAAASSDEEWMSPAVLRTQALVQGRRYEEGIRTADAALAVAERICYTTAVTRLRELRGVALLRMGQFDNGRDDLLAALRGQEEGGDADGEARVLFNLGTQLVEAGHARDAEGYLKRAGVIWRRAGNRPMLGEVQNSRALLHVLGGDLATAREEAGRAVAAAREVGFPMLECVATATLAEVCADSGDAAESERHAQAAITLAARLDAADALNDALRARIAVALFQRNRPAARKFIDEARPLILTPVDDALLDLCEGNLALRSRAITRACEQLGRAALRLEEVNRPQSAARAHLLHAEALLAAGAVRRTEDALNRMAELVLPLGCEGYMRPYARLARHVLAQRRTLRRLRRDTRGLLEALAASGPALVALAPSESAPVAPNLRFSPFGQGRITLSGRDLDLAALPPKARELLFYAAHAGRPVRRDELIEAIWEGDVASEQALWDAGRHVRRVIGDRGWMRRGRFYSLRPNVRDDGQEFQSSAANALRDGSALERLAAAEHALAIVGDGGFLEWCDSLWVATERAHVSRQAAAVALVAAECYADLARTKDAVAACRRAMAFEPFDEAPRLALLRQLVASGEVTSALREYVAYCRVLREELQAEPSAELVTLARNLGFRIGEGQ